MKYARVEDLLMDESFLAWYSQTDSKAMQIWNEWIAADPEHQQLCEEAIRLLTQIHIKEKVMTDALINAAVNHLIRAIESNKKNHEQ